MLCKCNKCGKFFEGVPSHKLCTFCYNEETADVKATKLSMCLCGVVFESIDGSPLCKKCLIDNDKEEYRDSRDRFISEVQSYIDNTIGITADEIATRYSISLSSAKREFIYYESEQEDVSLDQELTRKLAHLVNNKHLIKKSKQ